MPNEYHFEKSWFELYLVAGLILALWAAGAARVAKSRPVRKQSAADTRLGKQLVGTLIGAGIVATLVILFDKGASYLTRFDTEGVTYLSATGWRRELWKDCSKIILVRGKNPSLRVYLPYYSLDFYSQMFVHPEEVVRTLRAAVERHKKPRQLQPNAAST